ncbi:MAG: OadG family protein [Leptospirillia bacterium]
MNDFSDGIFLMGVGMGTVFLFLCLLIVSTELARMAIARDEPAPEPPSGAMSDAELTAVITTAINHHRKQRSGDG